MRNILCVVTSLACISHGWRDRTLDEQGQTRAWNQQPWKAADTMRRFQSRAVDKYLRRRPCANGRLIPSKALARFLLAFNPAVAFSFLAPGTCLSLERASSVGRRQAFLEEWNGHGCHKMAKPLESVQPDFTRLVCHRLQARRCSSPVATEDRQSIGDQAADYWNGLSDFAKALFPPRLVEDDMPEAVALATARSEFRQIEDIPTIANLTVAYARANMARCVNNPAVKDRLPDAMTAVNGIFVIIFLRALLPRVLAMQTMQDLYDFAPELGLPTREDLLSYVEIVGDMNYGSKLALFFLVICIEKMTLLGEFVPIGVIMPAVSPLLFGGILEGATISATCATVGSCANFGLARTFLRERALEFEIFDQPPVGETAWFGALSRNIEKDGFKAALLLRLAPVLPIPIDAHWYVAGLTSLKFLEFIPAYFIGALKACLLDAYLGSMLTSAAIGTDQVAASSQGIIAIETVAVITISVIVSQFATQLFADMLTEEGFDASSVVGKVTPGSDMVASESPTIEPEHSSVVGKVTPGSDMEAGGSHIMKLEHSSVVGKVTPGIDIQASESHIMKFGHSSVVGKVTPGSDMVASDSRAMKLERSSGKL